MPIGVATTVRHADGGNSPAAGGADSPAAEDEDFFAADEDLPVAEGADSPAAAADFPSGALPPRRLECFLMRGFFFILLLLSLGATLVILLAGLIVMARGGAVNARWSNRLMRWRVYAQAVTVAILFLALAS
ncbi:MAG: twin transmembrane helix small protein [Alphaproteobacteria bacterium]|nr:twin transmembrane helix small protein [Alphaproteobacteria bacterium]MDA8030556.1 twin transmembrane helix small protein [Alphaproteobacteria bacterium]